MNDHKLKEILCEKSIIDKEIIYHAVAYNLKKKGLEIELISDNLISVKFKDKMEAQLNILNLYDDVNCSAPDERFSKIERWSNTLMESVNVADKNHLNTGKTIIRVMHKKTITDIPNLSEKEKLKVLDSMSIKDISSELFLSVSKDSENTVSMISKDLIEETKDWKKDAIRNTEKLIGKDFSLAGGAGNTKLPFVYFSTSMSSLYLTLPISPKHCKKIAKLLNTNEKNIIFSFVHSMSSGTAFKKGDSRSLSAISLSISKESSNPAIFYTIGSDGMLEEYDVKNMI